MPGLLLELDLAAARTDVRFDLGTRSLLFLEVPDTLEVRIGELGADLVPATAGLRFDAPDGEAIPSIWATNPAGAGTASILALG